MFLPPNYTLQGEVKESKVHSGYIYVEVKPCEKLMLLGDHFDDVIGFRDDLANANGFRVSILRRHELLTKKMEDTRKKSVVGRKMEITATEVEVNVSSINLTIMCNGGGRSRSALLSLRYI
jgi:hypothetical protein